MVPVAHAAVAAAVAEAPVVRATRAVPVVQVVLPAPARKAVGPRDEAAGRGGRRRRHAVCAGHLWRTWWWRRWRRRQSCAERHLSRGDRQARRYDVHRDRSDADVLGASVARGAAVVRSTRWRATAA